MELRHYWEAVRDGWKIVAAFVVLALVAGAIYAFALPSAYSSTTSLYVATRVDSRNIEELSQRSAIAQQRVLSYAQVINGNVLANQVRREVGGEFELDDVEASLIPGTVVIKIQVLDADPGRARDIAAKYAELAPDAIRGLENSGEGGWQVDVEVIDDADVGETLGRSPVVVLPFAGVLGLGAGMTAATLWWLFRREASGTDESTQ